MTMTPERAQVRTLSAHLSPAQAADRAGVSRWTIMRAVKSGRIEGHRDNRNHWRLDLESVDAWAAAQCAHNEPAHLTHTPDAQTIELAELRVETRHLRERLNEMRIERDEWMRKALRPWWKRLGKTGS